MHKHQQRYRKKTWEKGKTSPRATIDGSLKPAKKIPWGFAVDFMIAI